jgi:hypothetical protein
MTRRHFTLFTLISGQSGLEFLHHKKERGLTRLTSVHVENLGQDLGSNRSVLSHFTVKNS